MPGTAAASRRRGELAAAAPHIGVVVMTMLEDDDAVVQALRAGARGYLVKGAAPERDPRRRPRRPRRPGGDRRRPSRASSRRWSAAGAPSDPFPDLTARERDVLAALAAGASTGQIADRLGLSDKTVRNHVSSILTKLEVPDRTQAVLKARAAGLTSERGVGGCGDVAERGRDVVRCSRMASSAAARSPARWRPRSAGARQRLGRAAGREHGAELEADDLGVEARADLERDLVAGDLQDAAVQDRVALGHREQLASRWRRPMSSTSASSSRASSSVRRSAA